MNGVGDTSITTSTGVNGIYNFSGLTPGVEYQVQFAAPASKSLHTRYCRDWSSDVCATDLTGLTQIVTLASGEYNPTLDAGVYQYASLGDRLWVDANANGQQDLGEVGISGQTVTLIGGGADRKRVGGGKSGEPGGRRVNKKK